ncbi:phosphotransferase RcsD [Candidatus Symbiopectobacterium sp. NZEC151]|uniref:phosphotransferase RcsD n=1 Tax=Candidatus Symbiopectobacterium sp. NZEC151 TaxID=2820470 RepID=UPI0022268AEA|nr:phosphotransferase RcsD [Candidatus Symbiopectobacterium sp. NZEC151]MCW2474705.1 phosphotransferase RcsD [Candidatus Symbiopectobacterium sp. NZEC151]
MPASLLRYLTLFTLLLLLTTGTLSYNIVNSWLAEKKSTLNTLALGMQKRIDTYRFFTYQIYSNLNNDAGGEDNVSAISLLPEVFYVEKNGQKTDALIFGQHDKSTLSAVRKISRYLDILWGAESDIYSMYYLNGVDNSLSMISTQILKDISAQFRGSYITAIAEARRTEMLQQSNALDERESFSPIRKLRFYNDYYFTLRTTFNQPGHLATIIAFDLPINDLIPHTLSRDNFILRADTVGASSEAFTNNDDTTRVQLNGSLLEVAAPLVNAPVNIVYQLPLRQFAADMARNNIWLLLLNLALLALTLTGFYLWRQPNRDARDDPSPRLRKQQALYQEIVKRIPVGILVYDFAANRVVVQNAIAEHLLPHLSLEKIAAMAREHQGVVQATINNEMYEILQFSQPQMPEHNLFLIREQDKEILVHKKMQLAQREYDKNVLARQRLLTNLRQELHTPMQALQQHLLSLAQTTDDDVRAGLLGKASDETAQTIALLDNIALHDQLDSDAWQPEVVPFSPLAMMDSLLLASLPRLSQKGLHLFHHYRLEPQRLYMGDMDMLQKALQLLLDYAITNTDYGKITLTLEADAQQADKLTIRLSDTGTRMSAAELDNLRHPWLTVPSADRSRQNSGFALFLCHQLARKLGGELSIASKQDLGTHYQLTFTLPASASSRDEDEKLLEDMTVLLDITANEVRQIVQHLLASWGAECINADERQMPQEFDLRIVDDEAKMADNTLLVNGEDTQVTILAPRRLRTNFNISQLLQDALLTLIEQQFESTTLDAAPTDIQEYARQLKASDYFSLFVETVPDDIAKLYTDAEAGDFSTLAQTAHRLKGVFAMLNLHPGKQLCEQLERHITEQASEEIKNDLDEIDELVRVLLQPNGQQDE